MTNARDGAAGRPQQRLRGALTLSAAVLVTALQDAFIKDLSGSYPIHQMQVLRAGSALTLTLIWLAASGGLRLLFSTPLSKLLVVRSLVLSMASLSFYVGLSAMPFADTVSLYYSIPLMIAALSGLLIGETVPLARWLAVAVAFVGVVIVLRPGSGLFEPASLIVLFSTLCYAIGLMLTRPVGMRVNSAVMGVWQLIAFLATGGALALVFGSGALHIGTHPSLSYLTGGWVMPGAGDLAKLLGTGVGAALATFLYTAGYRIATPSFVAPFEYSGLLWASILGFLMWGDIPPATTFEGAALIIAAGLWMIWHESRHQGSGIRGQKSV